MKAFSKDEVVLQNTYSALVDYAKIRQTLTEPRLTLEYEARHPDVKRVPHGWRQVLNVIERRCVEARFPLLSQLVLPVNWHDPRQVATRLLRFKLCKHVFDFKRWPEVLP